MAEWDKVALVGGKLSSQPQQGYKMTRQEEIREGIRRIMDWTVTLDDVDEILTYLHSQGVVIKSSTCPNCLGSDSVRFSANKLANICKECGWAMPPECSFVEPLVKE